MAYISLDDSTILNPKDEKKLICIEDKKNSVFSKQSKYNDISIVDSSIGRLLMFSETYQGGLISYGQFKGGMPYTRYFQLSRVINDKVNKILILGLGCGSVVFDCINIFDPLKIDIVEIDPDVIDIAYKYFSLPVNKKYTVFCDDARNYVFNNSEAYDLIVLDVFSAGGMPAELMTRQFIERLHSILNPDGIVTANFFGSETISGEMSNFYKAEHKTYSLYFPVIYSFPVKYGAYEFFRYTCDLRYKLSQITNIIMFAQKSNTKISREEFIIRAKDLQLKNIGEYFPDYFLYARDYYDEEINTDNLIPLQDELLQELLSSTTE